jgi:formylglycine-generating enzyme required for sulfatase activity
MTSMTRNPVDYPECPSWAGGFGLDEFGIFADLVWGKATQRLRWIAPGSFQMGSPENEMGWCEAEGPVHLVTIEHGFWIGDTPVTQSFYETVTGSNPSSFKGDGRLPVEQVHWDECRAFCDIVTAALSNFGEWRLRLPSEAEWEYACRAATAGPLYSGKPLTSETDRCPNLDEIAWYSANSGNTTHPVKEKAPNKWGLFDMIGNVWEWCEDLWHENYNSAPNDGSPWMDSEGQTRVFRGGSWDGHARKCRAAHRDWYASAGLRIIDLGFRLVLSRSLAVSLVQSPSVRETA